MKKSRLIIPLLITTPAVLSPLTACGEPQHRHEADFESERAEYIKILDETVDTTDYEGRTPQQIIEEDLDSVTVTVDDEQHESYFFNDINYTDPNQVVWPAHQHVVRTKKIAVLAHKTNNNELMDIVNKLTYYWLGHDYQNLNWWFNQIGVPQELSNVGLYNYESLSDKGKTKMISYIGRGSFIYTPSTKDYTGTNLFWFADITLKCGILEQSQSAIDTILTEVNDEIVEDQNEGFQSDGTYYQHGHQIYTGGYGRQGAITLSKIMSSMSDDDTYWGEEKLDIIGRFVLDGIKYFTHKGSLNYGVMGRTYTRPNSQSYKAEGLDLGNILELKYFTNLTKWKRKDELNALISKWENGESTFTGIKYFPKSCYITMNIDDVYMSFKGTNNNVVNTEKTNGENALGYNLSYGTSTCVMDSGLEYYNIAPVWDYSSIPGTTAAKETDEQLLAHSWDFSKQLDGTFNGGFDNENNVAYSMQQSIHDKKHFTITCFGTPDGMILLGSGLSHDEGKELRTTVEQCVIDNDVSFNPELTHVIRGNVIYKNIKPNSIFNIDAKEQEGDWSRNSPSYTGTETKKVVTITIEDEDKTSYAYSIQPLTKKNTDFILANNTPKAQAIVLPNGKMLATFYEESSFEYNGHTYSGGNNEFKVFNVI